MQNFQLCFSAKCIFGVAALSGDGFGGCICVWGGRVGVRELLYFVLELNPTR